VVSLNMSHHLSPCCVKFMLESETSVPRMRLFCLNGLSINSHFDQKTYHT
jgi:hypothetical protein